MMRWWWFGSAVVPDELTRELETMKAGGIGGVEIQPVYPLELDDPQTGFRNLPFLSPDFLKSVAFAARTGHDLGMRVSITLGSGWPYGGAWVPVTEASAMLRVVRVPLENNEGSIAVPSIRNGEKLLAAFVTAGTPDHYDAEHALRVDTIRDGRLILLPPEMFARTPQVPAATPSPSSSSPAAPASRSSAPPSAPTASSSTTSALQAVQDHLRNVADAADPGLRQSPSLFRLQRQPGSLRSRLDPRLPRRISKAPRLRSDPASARLIDGTTPRSRRPPLRLGPDADGADRRELPRRRSTPGRAHTARTSARRPTAFPP